MAIDGPSSQGLAGGGGGGFGAGRAAGAAFVFFAAAAAGAGAGGGAFAAGAGFGLDAAGALRVAFAVVLVAETAAYLWFALGWRRHALARRLAGAAA